MSKEPQQIDADLFAERREHEEVQAEKRRVSMILAIINKALDVLSKRLIILIALGASAAMFFWVLYDPDVIRLIASAIFTSMTFIPALFKKEV